MNDSTRQVRELLEAADELPHSPTRLAIEEEAVRLADTYRDAALGMEARQALMDTADSTDRGDVLATAFAWCLAQHDRDPVRFANWNVLEHYRRVIERLANLSDVTRASLEKLLADFGVRLERTGFSKRIWYYARQSLARDVGDPELARGAFQAMREHPRDAMSSAPEIELAEEIQAELFLGNFDQALQVARPFFDNPARTPSTSDRALSFLLVPLLERQRIGEASALNARCRRSYHPKGTYHWWYGNLLKFSAITGDLKIAAKLYGECQQRMNALTSGMELLHFSMDAIVVLDRLIAAGKRDLALRLADGVPVANRRGRYAVQDLRDWLFRDASTWAERFDVRNGNSYFRDQLKARAALASLVVEC